MERVLSEILPLFDLNKALGLRQVRDGVKTLQNVVKDKPHFILKLMYQDVASLTNMSGSFAHDAIMAKRW